MSRFQIVYCPAALWRQSDAPLRHRGPAQPYKFAGIVLLLSPTELIWDLRLSRNATPTYNVC